MKHIRVISLIDVGIILGILFLSRSVEIGEIMGWVITFVLWTATFAAPALLILTIYAHVKGYITDLRLTALTVFILISPTMMTLMPLLLLFSPIGR